MTDQGRTSGGNTTGAWRLWRLIGSGASYAASVRFEFKSLTLIGAGVAALYVLALGYPAAPRLDAVAATAAIPAAVIPAAAVPAAAVPAAAVPAATVPAATIPTATVPAVTAPASTIPEGPTQVAAIKVAAIPATAIEPRHETSFNAAPESLTALIIEKSALPNDAEPETVSRLVDLYQNIDYRLEDIRLGDMTVPRILVNKMPSDIAVIQSPAERKQLFIKLALPLILYANERIAADRERLMAIREKIAREGASLSEQAWLTGLASRYGLETPDLDALVRRVDVIPPSLALAQGAEESGWGTSRFVREGNAIFGQRTYDKGAGLVPKRRDSNAIHEVKTFNGLMDSVASYMTNLNTHDAYDEFRRIRAGQRAFGVVDGYSLVGALNRYSERGEAYVKTIRSIIDTNDLRSYDRASFGKLVSDDPKI